MDRKNFNPLQFNRNFDLRNTGSRRLNADNRKLMSRVSQNYGDIRVGGDIFDPRTNKISARYPRKMFFDEHLRRLTPTLELSNAYVDINQLRGHLN